MRKTSLLIVLTLVACGGKLDSGDAGTTGGPDGGLPVADASPPTADVIVSPPAPTCSPAQGSTSVDANGDCVTTATWSCGSTKYDVQCSCPSAQCSCSEQSGGSGSGTVLTQVPNVCPSCSGDLATICGFPH